MQGRLLLQGMHACLGQSTTQGKLCLYGLYKREAVVVKRSESLPAFVVGSTNVTSFTRPLKYSFH